MAHMKEDILIYGIGEGYKRYSTLINKYYNVALYLDGKKSRMRVYQIHGYIIRMK